MKLKRPKQPKSPEKPLPSVVPGQIQNIITNFIRDAAESTQEPATGQDQVIFQWKNGTRSILDSIKENMEQTETTIVIETPQVEKEILDTLSETAYKKKGARFMYITSWDLATYGAIVRKMKVFGNIQFRQLGSPAECWACTRDAQEVIFAPNAESEEEIIGIASTDEKYVNFYAQSIGPLLLAGSRPI